MLAETCACARQVGTGLKYNRDGARDALKKKKKKIKPTTFLKAAANENEKPWSSQIDLIPLHTAQLPTAA